MEIKTKDRVLAALARADGFLSGEKISKELSVSRMAVSHAAAALRAEGYPIEAVTNRGYRLLESSDFLAAGDLLAYLPKERMQSVLCLASVRSTNQTLWDMAQSGAPDGQVVLSDEQTGGRGRRGRSFHSPKKKGLYISLLLRPKEEAAALLSLTAWTAVAVCEAIRETTGLICGIKWVNDLIYRERKIGGILTEMAIEGESGAVQHAVIGIGINVNEKEEDFPEELRGKAGSLRQMQGEPVKRAHLAAELILALDRLRDAWPKEKEPYLAAYRKACRTVGRKILVHDGKTQRRAVAEAVGDDFSLCVRYDDGTRENLRSGEVSVRGASGYL